MNLHSSYCNVNFDGKGKVHFASSKLVFCTTASRETVPGIDYNLPGTQETLVTLTKGVGRAGRERSGGRVRGRKA